MSSLKAHIFHLLNVSLRRSTPCVKLVRLVASPYLACHQVPIYFFFPSLSRCRPLRQCRLISGVRLIICISIRFYERCRLSLHLLPEFRELAYILPSSKLAFFFRLFDTRSIYVFPTIAFSVPHIFWQILWPCSPFLSVVSITITLSGAAALPVPAAAPDRHACFPALPHTSHAFQFYTLHAICSFP